MELSQRWRWIGVEFTVIVLGVLSALFVDTWIEDRQDARKAEIYRQRLAADFETDVDNLRSAINYYTRIETYGLAALAYFEGRVELDDFTLLFNAFNAAEEWGFSSETSTFLDMQSTGNLSLLDNLTLRLNIANYHREIEPLRVVWALPSEFRALARGLIPNDLQVAIHEACVGYLGEAILQDSWKATLNFGAPEVGEYCGLDSEGFDVALAAERLRNHPEAEQLLRYRISQAGVSVRLFEGQEILAQQLLQQLQTTN